MQGKWKNKETKMAAIHTQKKKIVVQGNEIDVPWLHFFAKH